MCSKPANIPGVEVQPSKLAKSITRFLKDNNTAQHASADQSAAKRTKYTSAAVAPTKLRSLKAPKELKQPSRVSCISRALSNETINVPKEIRNAPTKEVHKSTETLSLLKRPHFVRGVSNEEAPSEGTAPSRQRLPPTKPKENLVHAPPKESLRGHNKQYPNQPSSKTVHDTVEPSNQLKRPLTAASGYSTPKVGSANEAFDCALSTDEHMSPYLTEIPTQKSCVLSHPTTNIHGLLHEKSSPVTTALVSNAKSEVTPKIPPNNSGKQGFFHHLIGTAKTSVASILSFSPPHSRLQSPLLPLPSSSAQAQDNLTSLLLQSDPSKSRVFSSNTDSLISDKIDVDYHAQLDDEAAFVKHIETTFPALLTARAHPLSPHCTTDSQRPNLLSLHSACFSDQQQMNASDMLATKWSSDCEMLVASERDKLESVTFNHIGQKVIVSGKKVGILKYFGGIEFECGNWCGIELDEPAGLNDGSIKGVRYFSCRPRHGILAPQTKVKVFTPMEPKQQFCDMLPIVNETSHLILLGRPTKNSSLSTDSFETSKDESTELPSTTAKNSNQVWETNAGSPKPAQQINISKQNSFELDESLGILTPDQLPDQLVSLSNSVNSFLLNQASPEPSPAILKDAIETEMLCESDGSEDLLSRAVLSKSDPKNVDVSDRTLSPEDLPMDPPAPLGSEETKEARSPGPSSRSHPAPTSFVTSITSIGSLDTDGYQGDGELSRPASRNNCTSPTGLLPHKACVSKMKTSTQDPMTDSDFFTESDADDLAGPGRGGDRHAQVIDGTLYNNGSNGGGLNQQHQRCPSFTASINEEMESSGVYSDLERKPEETNNEVKPGNVVFSPDISTNTDSTKSEPSQVKDTLVNTSESPVRTQNPLDITLTEINTMNVETTEELEEDRMEVVQGGNENKEFEGTPSVISNTSSLSINDSKSSKKGIELKKYKMPKRNVVSKIKAMIEASPSNRGGNASTEEDNLENTSRGSIPKTPRKGRWDAVMSKIAQGQADEKMKPARLKEVKSKVFATLTETPGSTSVTAKRKLPPQLTNPKKEHQTPLKTKSRRGRTRASSSSSLPTGPQVQPDSGAGASPNSSQRSSLSDLTATPTPKPTRSSKKILPVRSTSPSPASDLSTHSGGLRGHPTPPHVVARVASVEMKTPPARKPASRRGEKHKLLRDHNRLAACVPPKQPPTVEPPPAPHVVPAVESPELRHAAKSVQVLAIMVQYLVHEVDAFATPHLKERLSQMTAAWRTAAQERDELAAGNSRLQEDLHKANSSFQQQLEEIRLRHQEELNKVVLNCEDELSQRATAHAAQLEVAIEEHRAACEQLRADHEVLLVSNRASVQQEHQATIKQLQSEQDDRLTRLQAKYDTLESDNLKGNNQYRMMLESMKLDKDSRLQTTASQCKELQDEVNSLRTVLAIRLEELQDMRIKNLILEREKEEHHAEINRNSSLQARIEDLEAQIEVKGEHERMLSIANHRLSESFQHESYNAKRLSQHNEELQWKLKTQSEMCNKLASGSTSGIDMSLKALLGNCNTQIDFCSDGLSDKAVCCSGDASLHKTSYLERSDSVAWTFDMVDSCKKVAKTGGRIRRIKSFHDTNSSGFRDFSTSPRHNKSASVGEKRRSDIDSGNCFSEWPVATSTPVRTDLNKQMGQNADFENAIEIDQNEPLVGVETVLGEKNTCSNIAVQVPAVPKEAAGEAMISEETSEEEDSSEQHSTDEESSSEVMLS